VRDREKERERDPPRRAGEPCFEEGRKTLGVDKERTVERERAREIEIETTETEYARKRQGQRVQCDTYCTHKYPMVHAYCSPLLTHPRSTPSPVSICGKQNTFWVGDN